MYSNYRHKKTVERVLTYILCANVVYTFLTAEFFIKFNYIIMLNILIRLRKLTLCAHAVVLVGKMMDSYCIDMVMIKHVFIFISSQNIQHICRFTFIIS